MFAISFQRTISICVQGIHFRDKLSVPLDGWKSLSVTLLVVKCTVLGTDTDTATSNLHVVCYVPAFTFWVQSYSKAWEWLGIWKEQKSLWELWPHAIKNTNKPKWCRWLLNIRQHQGTNLGTKIGQINEKKHHSRFTWGISNFKKSSGKESGK